MIKNYTSSTPNTFAKIEKILATHKATKIMNEYGSNGRLTAISFAIMVGDREVGFKLPARFESVANVMYGTSNLAKLGDKQVEQAYRTAWANIRDWLDAQMALVDTEQAKTEEVFLPYAVQRDGRTYFEHAKEDRFLLGEVGSNE